MLRGLPTPKAAKTYRSEESSQILFLVVRINSHHIVDTYVYIGVGFSDVGIVVRRFNNCTYFSFYCDYCFFVFLEITTLSPHHKKNIIFAKKERYERY